MKLLKTKFPSLYYQTLLNGDITYYGKYRDKDGKSKRKKLGTKKKDNITEKQCFLMLEELKKKEKNYNDVFEEEELIYNNFLTLTQLSKKYYDNRRLKKRKELRSFLSHIKDEEEFLNHKIVLRKFGRITKEEKRIKKNILNFEIGKIPANRITRKIVNKYMEEDLGLLNLTQSTKYWTLNFIKTIFNYGIDNDIISINNPFKNIKLDYQKKTRKRIITELEILELLKKCKEYKKNINVYLSVYLGVLTGGRVQTILNIKKKDINIKNKTIHLTNFKNKNHQYAIRLNEKSCLWLDKKILDYYEPNEYLIRPKSLCYRKNPPQPMTGIPEKVYQIMDELFNEGLDKKNNSDRDYVFNFHSIRRTIGSNLVKNGSSVYNVMKFLDHSSVNQTMDYLNIDSNDDIVDLINTIFDSEKIQEEKERRESIDDIFPF